MTDRQIAPCGSWRSPITADALVSGTIRLGEVQRDGDTVYWLEGRPAEGGRTVLVRREPGDKNQDVTPPPFNVRTRVHEYGGGAYLVSDGEIYFSNFSDNRLYRMRWGEEPQPTTPEAPWRYADGVMDRKHGRTIWVREDHALPDHEAINTIVSIPFDGGEQEVLVGGSDFYSSPRISPDGDRLAWLTWNHPNMPWDGTELWTADIAADGSLHNQQRIAGGRTLSIFQPEWSPAGELFFVSEETGWWNLYRSHNGAIAPVAPDEAEYGQPQWVFRESTYGFCSDDELLAIRQSQGESSLRAISVSTGTIQPVPTPYSAVESLVVASGWAAFIAGSPTRSPAVVRLDLSSNRVEVLQESASLNVSEDIISVPQAVEFPTEDGKTAHAFYYPPHNPEFQAPPGELPPLIVKSHGGPTGATTDELNLAIQYWTSRGFAVLDVNYGGSTGYGREYRQRLNGQWGLMDVADCVNGALAMVREGKADPDRLIITGGSAGGYTTLNALTFRDVFKAGASYYGIGDLEPFVQDTHKFESRYLESLIGPYPQQLQRYRERSAVNYTDQLSAPMILFQGLDDKVVPPNQAELMVQALQRKGLPHAYIAYEGEGHGFRKAENIKRSLEGELYFYSRIFGFPLSEQVEPIAIANLD